MGLSKSDIHADFLKFMIALPLAGARSTGTIGTCRISLCSHDDDS